VLTWFGLFSWLFNNSGNLFFKSSGYKKSSDQSEILKTLSTPQPYIFETSPSHTNEIISKVCFHKTKDVQPFPWPILTRWLGVKLSFFFFNFFLQWHSLLVAPICFMPLLFHDYHFNSWLYKRITTRFIYNPKHNFWISCFSHLLSSHSATYSTSSGWTQLCPICKRPHFFGTHPIH